MKDESSLTKLKALVNAIRDFAGDLDYDEWEKKHPYAAEFCVDYSEPSRQLLFEELQILQAEVLMVVAWRLHKLPT